MPLSWNFEPSKDEKKKRVHVNKKDVKNLFGNVCKICGKPEKEVGQLEMAHYKAHSRGGNIVFPLCPNCHVKYDKGMLNSSELKKIGLTSKEYSKYRPKKSGVKKESKTKDPFAIDLPDVKIPTFDLKPSKKKKRKKKDPFSIF